MLRFHAAQTRRHSLRTQFFCPQQMLRARANGETFVSATMCLQQCVLVCQYLQIELSPELCSRLAENTLIIKKKCFNLKSSKTFDVEDTFINVLTFQVVRKTRKVYAKYQVAKVRFIACLSGGKLFFGSVFGVTFAETSIQPETLRVV